MENGLTRRIFTLDRQCRFRFCDLARQRLSLRRRFFEAASRLVIRKRVSRSTDPIHDVSDQLKELRLLRSGEGRVGSLPEGGFTRILFVVFGADNLILFTIGWRYVVPQELSLQNRLEDSKCVVVGPRVGCSLE